MKKWACNLKGKVSLCSASIRMKLELVCFLKDLWERLRVKIRYLNAAMENGGTYCGVTGGVTSF